MSLSKLVKRIVRIHSKIIGLFRIILQCSFKTRRKPSRPTRNDKLQQLAHRLNPADSSLLYPLIRSFDQLPSHYVRCDVTRPQLAQKRFYLTQLFFGIQSTVPCRVWHIATADCPATSNVFSSNKDRLSIAAPIISAPSLTTLLNSPARDPSFPRNSHGPFPSRFPDTETHSRTRRERPIDFKRAITS